MGRRPRVCVIGAGVAGIRTAELLHQYGAHVTMFEARDRFGGRLAQSDHLGHTVDLGPNWVHGTVNNPILHLAHETGTILHSWDEAQTTFDASGEALETEEGAELQATYWGIVFDAFQFSKEKQGSIDRDKSLLDFFRQQVPSKFVDQPKAMADRRREILHQCAELWGAYVGSPTARQSLRFFWLESLVDEESPFVAGTYSKILARITESVVGKVDVQFKQQVDSILTREDQRVEVTVQGQAPEAFDEVVVTVPLGCLKAGDIAFTPEMPRDLQQAIDSIGYGCLDKVYITFPSAFWQDAASSAARIGFYQWLAPSYDQINNPSRWSIMVVNLAALPSAAAQPTLLFYIFGDCAQHIAKLATTAPSEQADAALLRFFEPYFSRLPGYSAADSSCKPSAVLATAWANDKFAGHGSYSNFQVGLEHADRDIETIRKGMPERHVWFAGEHTAPFAALGTVTGAYQSGEAVAQRMISNWQVGQRAEMA